MAAFKSDEHTFTITNSGGSGCVFVFITVLGLLMTIGGSFGVNASFSVDADFHYLMLGLFAFMAALGIILTWTGLRSPARNYKEEIVFDKQSSTVRFFFNNLGKTPYEVCQAGEKDRVKRAVYHIVSGMPN